MLQRIALPECRSEFCNIGIVIVTVIVIVIAIGRDASGIFKIISNHDVFEP